MLTSKALKWTGPGIGNSWQRLTIPSRGARHFSINTPAARVLRVQRQPLLTKSKCNQQYRSLSLFGWGSSSKPTSSDPTSLSQSSDNVDIGPSTTGLDNVRTIKASHATSDVPDPSQTHSHPPNNIEPQFIEDFQETITLPHGDAAERVMQIGSGEADISTVPERMGYLKEVCGLDFGWGPTAIMETVLEWLHLGAGLSWTASIMAMAIVLRVAMIQPMVVAQQQATKMREMQPFMKPVQEKYLKAMKAGDQAKAMEFSMQMKAIKSSSGVSYIKGFVPLLIQIPFSYGAFRVLRNAGQLPVPGFVTENWLWTTDLSFSDPYFITPAISAATIYFSFKLSQTSSNAMIGPQMLKVLSIFMPMASFLFMAFQPGAVQLYFMSTGVLAFTTAALLRQGWFRNWAKLGPLPTGPPPALNSATPIQPRPSPLPSNIQRMVPITRPSPQPNAAVGEPTQDRSMIDKAVDTVKGGWKDVVNLANKDGTFGKKQADRAREARDAANARLSALRQREIEKEREVRNEQARSKQ